MANPQICHDSSKYLRCYNDGYFFLAFKQGDVSQVRTSDYDFSYDPVNKAINFFRDTMQLILLPAGILVKKGQDSLLISSMEEFSSKLAAFDIKAEKKYTHTGELALDVNGKIFTIEVSTGYKEWLWEIDMVHTDRRLYIQHAAFKKNRLERIGLNDDQSKHWVNLSTAFKSGKKIWRLSANQYVDTVLSTQFGESHQPYPLSKDYIYEYDKKGRLKHGYGKAFMKLCDCEE